MPRPQDLQGMDESLIEMLNTHYKKEAPDLIQGVKARLILSREGIDPDIIKDDDGKIKGLENYVVSLAGHGDRAINLCDQLREQFQARQQQFPSLNVLKERAQFTSIPKTPIPDVVNTSNPDFEYQQ